MKLFEYSILFTVIIFFSCKPQKVSNSKQATSIKFDSTHYYLGDCVEGDTLSFYARYANTGKYPLIIDFTNSSCGCTASVFNKKALAPGCVDSILVRYNTRGMNGKSKSTVVVGANTDPFLTQVFFTANVLTGKN